MRQNEVTGEVVIHAPGLGDFDVFDYAYGIEIGYRHWWSDILGVGVGIAYENWVAGGGARNWAADADGDLRVYPLSLSGYLRAADLGWCELVTLVALEYAICDSEIAVSRGGASDTASVDDSVNVRLGLEFGAPLTDNLRLTCGVGFQFPLMKGDASALGGPLMDVDMQSFYAGVGLSLAF